jgi:NADPH2:quinone reductase
VRAAVLHQYGAPEYTEFESPSASDGEVVVRVEAAGLNPTDLQWGSGKHYLGAPPLPYVPGREGVGSLEDRRRVFFDPAVAPFGSLAEYALVREADLVDLPAELDSAVAIAVGLAGMTAWLALEATAALEPGETVLVLGATGAVGQVAVQAAKLLGAGRVVAAGRDADGRERARAQGADATVDLGATESLAEAFLAAAEGRIDVIVDPIWGGAAVEALAVAAPGARLVQIGSAAGSTATVDASVLRRNRATVIGFVLTAIDREARTDCYRRLADLAMTGQLTVDVERIPLREISSAWRRQGEGAKRKLVLVP